MKKATVNPKNNDDKYFQYTAILALNRNEIGKNAERIIKIKSFIDKCNWKGTNYPSRKNDWKKYDKSLTIAINALYAKKKKQYTIYPV